METDYTGCLKSKTGYDIVDRFINIYKEENTPSEDTNYKDSTDNAIKVADEIGLCLNNHSKVDPCYDTVDSPVGYTSGCMETKEKIKIMLDDKDLLPSQSFNLGNVIKYIDRHQLKGSALEDIEKAIGYLTMYKNSLREDD